MNCEFARYTMKMEHAVRAPRAGIVRRIHFTVGECVDESAVLIDLQDLPGPTV